MKHYVKNPFSHDRRYFDRGQFLSAEDLEFIGPALQHLYNEGNLEAHEEFEGEAKEGNPQDDAQPSEPETDPSRDPGQDAMEGDENSPPENEPKKKGRGRKKADAKEG